MGPAGAAPVVMLGHDVWRTRYQSDPAIVGRTARVDGVPTTIAGVMPEGFEFPLNGNALAAARGGARNRSASTGTPAGWTRSDG